MRGPFKLETPMEDNKKPAPAANEPLTMDAATKKKVMAQAKLDFQLHVALIMKQDQATKNNALFKAWLEGEKGLAERLQVKASA